MPVITLLRGFKVHYAVLDAFLMANGLIETFGSPPIGNEYNDIAKLLHSKMGDAYVGKGARVVVPSHGSGYSSMFAYVAYSWMHIYAHRELQLETQLPEDCPVEFEELRREILSFEDDKNVKSWQRSKESGRMGLYVVYTDSQNWFPKTLLEPVEGPANCEECNETFQSTEEKRMHWARKHGIAVKPRELPEI